MARRTSLSAKWAAWERQCRKILRVSAAKKCAELVALASRTPARATFRIDHRRPASTVPTYKRAGKRR